MNLVIEPLSMQRPRFEFVAKRKRHLTLRAGYIPPSLRQVAFLISDYEELRALSATFKISTSRQRDSIVGNQLIASAVNTHRQIGAAVALNLLDQVALISGPTYTSPPRYHRSPHRRLCPALSFPRYIALDSQRVFVTHHE